METTFDAADFHQTKLQNQLIQQLAAVEAQSNSTWATQQGQNSTRLAIALNLI
ncbi:hypothetical protein IQ255_02950 [Pleurocapsales cyanobacterium LEGE 10410]|nr:hypothetical protein [Pleurocapsales cyanobacterium LEGE 10410]